MQTKSVDDSRCEMTEIVLPNDTNGLGTLMGGRLLHLMDKCAAISAMRHSQEVCVTASVDNVEFTAPIRQNEVVVIQSRVNRAFRTSMEVELNVWAENPRLQTRRKCNRAYYTFVALNERGESIPMPGIEPRTDKEQRRFEGAGKRREIRLVLAGKMDLSQVEHLKQDMHDALLEQRRAEEAGSDAEQTHQGI